MVSITLPPGQIDMYDADSCLEGFLVWNEYWKNYSSRKSHQLPIEIVHTAYQNWFTESKGKFSEFKELWENTMIRSTSEAACETMGSLMNIHAGSNRHLQPFYYNIELYLRWNLGPLHLMKNLVKEVYDKEKKNYIRSTTDPNKLKTKNIAISSGIGSSQTRSEEKSHLPALFWL